jgi:hypothetical protein
MQEQRELVQEFSQATRLIWREWGCCVLVEALKKKLSALEEVAKRFVAHNNIFYHLYRMFHEYTTAKDIRRDLPQKEH